MKLRMEYRVGMGEQLPPWYYGLSSMEDYGRVLVFHVMPIHFLVIASLWIRFLWGRFRTRRTWFDEQLNAHREKAWDDGYAAGRRDEERRYRHLGFK